MSRTTAWLGAALAISGCAKPPPTRTATAIRR